jgi:hypothetical protein
MNFRLTHRIHNHAINKLQNVFQVREEPEEPETVSDSLFSMKKGLVHQLHGSEGSGTLTPLIYCMFQSKHREV